MDGCCLFYCWKYYFFLYKLAQNFLHRIFMQNFFCYFVKISVSIIINLYFTFLHWYFCLGLYFFIPILAVIVVAATLYFGGRRSDEEEYLFMHTESADANLQGKRGKICIAASFCLCYCARGMKDTGIEKTLAVPITWCLSSIMCKAENSSWRTGICLRLGAKRCLCKVKNSAWAQTLMLAITPIAWYARKDLNDAYIKIYIQILQVHNFWFFIY